MYVNLNPPTVCLAVLGVAQLMILSLARPALRRWSAHPSVRLLSDAIGSRSMTVYLWHMPVLIGLAGVLVALAPWASWALPAPLTTAWWTTRPAWLLLTTVAVAVAVAATSRFEKRSLPVLSDSRARVAGASVLGAGSVAILLAAGFSPAAGLTCALGMTSALALARGRTSQPVSYLGMS